MESVHVNRGRSQVTYRAVHCEAKIQQEQAEIPWSKAISRHEDDAAHYDNWDRVHPENVAHLQPIR